MGTLLNMRIRIFVFIISLFGFPIAQASLGEDLKTLGLSSLYGTLGGTLVGVAGMALGGSTKSIAKGASIGLYAGLGIGGFFVVKNNMTKKPLAPSPYPSGDPSKMYDNVTPDDYDDVYYGKKWETVGNWDYDPLNYTYEHQLNRIKASNDLKIYFSLFQKNF